MALRLVDMFKGLHRHRVGIHRHLIAANKIEEEARKVAQILASDDESEPSGWHRHPATGRRRPDGDPTKEYVRP